MRRLALLGLCSLTLSGCGLTFWHRAPFFADGDPYAPPQHSENMDRVRGMQLQVQPLSEEAGNVWPGPVQATPSLEDLVKQERTGQLPMGTLPGQPQAPMTPAPSSGVLNAPSPQPVIPYVPPISRPGRTPSGSMAPGGGTGIVQTQQGQGVTSGGSGAFKSITLPNGMTGIVVPNGNGTSTVILSNGQVQTIPDHK